HPYQLGSPIFSSGQLTGTWAPDGRNIDPQSSGSVFDAASPTADLSVFNNTSANGAWTLFIADLSGGGQSTLVSWGLTVVTVPEPQTWTLLGGSLAALWLATRKRQKKNAKKNPRQRAVFDNLLSPKKNRLNFSARHKIQPRRRQ